MQGFFFVNNLNPTELFSVLDMENLAFENITKADLHFAGLWSREMFGRVNWKRLPTSFGFSEMRYLFFSDQAFNATENRKYLTPFEVVDLISSKSTSEVNRGHTT